MARKYRIRDREYTIHVADLDGWCDLPDDDDDLRIGISPRLRGRARLETALHETLHAIMPKASEAEIDEAAKFQTAILWDQGYRRRSEARPR